MCKKNIAHEKPRPAVAVITDDVGTRDELAALLTSHGYEVSTYSTRDAFEAERARAVIHAGHGRRTRVERRSGVRFQGAELLTAREIDVLEQIAQGASNEEAAQSLGISRRTVESHRASILEKLGARNTAALIRIVLGGDQ